METIFIERLGMLLLGDFPPGTKEFLELSHDQYEQARPFVEQHRALVQQDDLFARQWGWKLYHRLKRCVSETRARRRAFDRLPNRLARQIAEVFEEYEQLHRLHRADLLQSLMLLQTCQLYVPWKRALQFFYRVKAFDTLRPEDRKPYIKADRVFPSLELRLVQYVAKTLAKLPPRVLPPVLVQWALARIQEALPRLPEEELWPRYHLACIWLRQGRTDEARPLLAPVLRAHRKKSWIWEKVAQSNLPDRPLHALTAWTQALRCARHEHPVVRFRMHVALARLLAQLRRYDEAASQLQAARMLEGDVRHPGSVYAQLLESSWFQERAERSDLPGEPSLQINPDVLLSEHLSVQEGLGIVVHHDLKRRRTLIRLTPTRTCTASHETFPQVVGLALGTPVWLKNQGRRVLALEVRPEEQLPELARSFQGRYQPVKGKEFAFVRMETGERIFIPPAIARQLKLRSGARVQGIAERTMDPTKRRLSWSALTVEPLS